MTDQTPSTGENSDSTLPEIDECVTCRRGFFDECGHEPVAIFNEEDDYEILLESKAPRIPRTHRAPQISQRDAVLGLFGEKPLMDESRFKDDEASIDPHSTGRKRAAKLYPLDRSKPCEWSGLDKAGGGIFPIKGCVGQLQSNRHHGPDKNTLNNDRGNVHRICTKCHRNWHAANDEFYDPDNPVGWDDNPLLRDDEGSEDSLELSL